MTFEEFLIKKKIDLAQFSSAEPGLFLEFRSHYQQMGEKSFDHSKKFLFNKLRRAYHLKEEPKPVPAKETIEVNEIAFQAEPLLSPTVEATVYTPRFRAGGTAKTAPSAETPDTPKTEKPAYTPRFKAPAKKDEPQKDEPASDLRHQNSDLSTDKPKPAYVPRFKAPAPKKEEPRTDEPASDPGPQASDLSPDKPKPAYVPRFKAPVIKKDETQAPVTGNEQENQPSQTSDLQPPTSDPGPSPAYKPRFKPSMVKPKKEE